MKIAEISKDEYFALSYAISAAMKQCVEDRQMYYDNLEKCANNEQERIKRYQYMSQAKDDEFNRLNDILREVGNAYFKSKNK